MATDKHLTRTESHVQRLLDEQESRFESRLAQQEQLYDKLIKQQSDNFKSFLESFMSSSMKRIDDININITKDMQSVKSSLTYTQNELDDLKQELKQLTNQNDRNVAAAPEMPQNIKDIETSLTKLSGMVDSLENHSRRNNLRIEGIRESPGEKWSDTEQKVRKLVQDQLGLDQDGTMVIERAHRVGPNPSSYANVASHDSPRKKQRPRSVVVNFLSYRDRDQVLRNAYKLGSYNRDRKSSTNNPISIREDVSERVVNIRKSLLPKLNEARSQGKIAYLNFDRLVIRNPRPKPAVPQQPDADKI